MTPDEAIRLGDEISLEYEKLLADIQANRLTQQQIDTRLAELEAMQNRVRDDAYGRRH